MNILRKIKLNTLGYYEIIDDEKELITFIKDNLLDLKEIKLNKYQNVRFWFKNDRCIFEYSLYKNKLSINNIDIRFYLLYLFGYDDQGIENLSKCLMKNYILDEIILDVISGFDIALIEQEYKNEYNKTI